MLRMLTSTSLAAFSTQPDGGRIAGSARPEQPARADGRADPRPPPVLAAATQPRPNGGGTARPSRVLPRGSLVDLAI